MPRVWLIITLCLAALVAGCGVKKDPLPGPKVTPPPGLTPAPSLPGVEDRLRLVAPAGYVDRGSFEDTTGCEVDVTEAETSDDVVRLMSSGRFDGALGTGDATVRLIAAGAIAPVNTELVDGYADVYDGLKLQTYNSVGGEMFALPVGRAANVIVYSRDQVPGTLNGLASVLDPAQVASYGGQVVVPDDPNHIAEAALWVQRQRDDLEITDPYELDRRQFNAVIDVLRHQKPYVQQYWTSDRDVVVAFNSGEAAVGLVSQEAAAIIERGATPEKPFGDALPKEGSSGLSPAWMVAAKPAHPGCMYRWLTHALDPQVQSRVSQAVHIAPSNRRTCEMLEAAGKPEFCEQYHADDDGYWEKVLYRTTPTRDCGDSRGRVCVDWDGWRKAWQSLTAGS